MNCLDGLFSSLPFNDLINHGSSITQNPICQLAQRIFNSTLFWAGAGCATLVITSAVVISGALSPIPFAIVGIALGLAMLVRVAVDFKRFVFESTLMATVLSHTWLKNPWYHDILKGQLTLGAIPLVNYTPIEEFKNKQITAVLTVLEPHEWCQTNLFGTPVTHGDWNFAGIHHDLINSPDFIPLSQKKIKIGVRLLKENIQDNNGHVYVHCKAGVGRSATIVVCYILQYGTVHGLPKFTPEEAIAYVKNLRPSIMVRQDVVETFYKGLNDTDIPSEIEVTGQGILLPTDAARIVFQNLKADLPSVALVCKNWKAIVDDEDFRKMIRPVQAFGTQEWNEYIGVDPGAEPCLPRCAYGDLEREDGLLTFIPERVRVAKDNGETEIVPLDLEAIGNLVENPRKGNKTGYHEDMRRKLGLNYRMMMKNKKNEKPHWVWIKKEVMDVMGRKKSILGHWHLFVKEFSANISGVIDTATSFFMEYIRSGERTVIWDATKHNFLILTNELFEESRISLAFVQSRLEISCCDYNDYDFRYDVAVLLARRSFGLGQELL